MAKNLTDILTGIAKAIRTINDVVTKYNAQDMPDLITALPVGPAQSTLLWEDDAATKESVTITIDGSFKNYDYLCFVLYDPAIEQTDNILISTTNIFKCVDDIPSFEIGNSIDTGTTAYKNSISRTITILDTSTLTISNGLTDNSDDGTLYPTCSVPMKLYGVNVNVTNLTI